MSIFNTIVRAAVAVAASPLCIAPASRTMSYTCSEYTYHYHNRDLGEKAYLTFRMTREDYLRFVTLYWPKSKAPVFQNLLLTQRAGGWYRVDCMSDQAELRLRKFLRLMNLYFTGRREKARKIAAAAKVQDQARDTTLIHRYQITVSKSFRQTTRIDPATKGLREQAKAVIAADPVTSKPAVDQAKLKALAAKFQSHVSRGNSTVH